MKTTQIHLTGNSLGEASTHLLGFNLDWLSDLPAAIYSQRLDNPTFFGPADFQTGLAPSWKKMMDFYGGLRFELEPGAGMAGGPCQRVHVYDRKAQGGHSGMVQPGRYVRKGETMRVILWARCQGEPVVLQIGFRHKALAGPDYGFAEIRIDRSHFARYEVEFSIRADDDDCLFYCYLQNEGIVYFDRILAEPVGEPVFRTDTLEAMSILPIGALRWPAGCTSASYHWRRGVGPEYSRYDDADMTFHWSLSYTRGTDEYLELCAKLGTTPHLIANIGTGTPEEAGAWAEYCDAWYRERSLEPPQMIWQIGNEHFGAHEAGHMTAKMYVQTLRDFVPLIKKAYPNALICSAACEDDWIEAIIEDAPELVDILSMHFYACHYDWSIQRSGLAFLADARHYARRLDEVSTRLQGRGLPIKIAVTEWGAFRGESHTDAKFYDQPTTWGALWIDAMLKSFARRAPRVVLCNAYSLLNVMPALVTRGPQVYRTAYGDVFASWKDLLPSTILETRHDGTRFVPPSPDSDPANASTPWLAECENSEGENSLPWLDELCGENHNGRWLMLTNRHPEQEIEVRLPAGFDGARAHWLLPLPEYSNYDATQVTQVKDNRVILPPGAHCKILTA